MSLLPTQIIEFFVEGRPKPQPRVRARVLGKGEKAFAGVYDPETSKPWKRTIAAVAPFYKPARPITGPVSVTIDFYMPRPKSHYRTGRYADQLKPDAPVRHTTGGGPYGGDRDNLEKAVTDCLTKLGFWKDDGQVCAGEVRKFWSNGKSGAKIIISEIT